MGASGVQSGGGSAFGGAVQDDRCNPHLLNAFVNLRRDIEGFQGSVAKQAKAIIAAQKLVQAFRLPEDLIGTQAHVGLQLDFRKYQLSIAESFGDHARSEVDRSIAQLERLCSGSPNSRSESTPQVSHDAPGQIDSAVYTFKQAKRFFNIVQRQAADSNVKELVKLLDFASIPKA